MIWLRIFKNNRAGGVLGVIILAIALFLISFLRPEQPVDFSDMPFYRLIFGAIHTVPVLNRIITLILMLFICLMLVRITFRYVLLEHRSYMPGFFFLLFSAALPSSHQVSPALVGSLFYIICFAMLFRVHEKEPRPYTVFNASMVLALGSMFYMKLIWFIPLIWVSIGTLRPVTLRELIYPVVAFLILGLFLFTWYWGVQDNAEKLAALLRENLAFNKSLRPYHFSVYLYYGFFILLVIIASAYMVRRFPTRKTSVQNIFQVLFYIFIAALLFFVLVARFAPAALVYVAFPVSLLMADYFHRRRNPWLHELAMWILVSLVVYVQLMV
jgi:hypothetical protein